MLVRTGHVTGDDGRRAERRNIARRRASDVVPIDGTRVCVLRVPAAPRAIWVSNGSGKVLYVRSGNSTQPLDSEAAPRYISSHFGMRT